MVSPFPSAPHGHLIVLQGHSGLAKALDLRFSRARTRVCMCVCAREGGRVAEEGKIAGPGAGNGRKGRAKAGLGTMRLLRGQGGPQRQGPHHAKKPGMSHATLVPAAAELGFSCSALAGTLKRAWAARHAEAGSCVRSQENPARSDGRRPPVTAPAGVRGAGRPDPAPGPRP